MKKKFKKLLSVITALAVAATMTSATVSLSYAGETGDPAPQSDVTTTLGMFTPENAKVTIKDDATASVEFTVPLKGSTVKSYNKLALVAQTESAEAKENAKIDATVNEDGSSTFKFDIKVSQLGKQIPFSTYRVYKEKEGEETLQPEWNEWQEQPYITFNSPSIVDQMISKIYVQTRNENTDEMCTAAKACWDGLLDEQKKLVQEYDYFGLDTGDASKDNPLNQDGIGKKELLVVSFGTSFNNSRAEDIGSIEKALADAYPDYSVRRAFTSQIIINHIQARDGYAIDNVTQAMDRAVKNRVKQMVVQPTHLMSGSEYDEMKKEIDKYSSQIDIVYGTPLLNSDTDRTTVAKTVASEAAKAAGYSSIMNADKDVAFVFLGHGTSHENQKRYTQMQQKFEALGFKNCFMGTVEGIPQATSIESIIKAVRNAGYRRIVLRPLMVVAGDHAENDMAGDDEDSWKRKFEDAGFEVDCQIHGLGGIDEIQQIYIKHTSDAIKTKDEIIDERDEAIAKNNENESAIKEAEAQKVAAEKARIEAENTIKILNAKLAVMGTKVGGVKAKAYKSSHKITVKWSKNSKVTGYKVYRATSPTGKYKLVKTTTGKTVTIKKHKKGKTYYYKVVGYKKIAGKTIYSKDSTIKKVKAK